MVVHQVNDFLSAEPFPHLLLSNVVPVDLLHAIHAEFDAVPPDAWVHYAGPDECGKRACNQREHFGPASRAVFDWLTCPAKLRELERLSGIEGLQSDPEMYGGGMHATKRGGFLGLHLDNERHPTTGLARRLNLIVYCTPDWREEWGGKLELWDRGRTKPIVEIAPLFGRAVLFETGNHSYHGHTKPLECPEGIERRSLSVFYWSAVRERARFLSPAGISATVEIERRRLARSRLTGARSGKR